MREFSVREEAPMRAVVIAALLSLGGCVSNTGPGPMEQYAARLQAGCSAGDRAACQQMTYTGGLAQEERCQRYREIRSTAFATGGLIGMAASNNPRPAGC